MAKLQTTARIVNGIPRSNNKAEVIDFFKKHDSKLIKVTYQTTDIRSNDLNSYYWGVMIPELRKAINEQGDNKSSEWVHNFIKANFVGDEFTAPNGELMKGGGSTADLSNKEFCDLMDKVIIFAADVLGYKIPYPNEQIEIDMV
jgi:hypothetical protein